MRSHCSGTVSDFPVASAHGVCVTGHGEHTQPELPLACTAIDPAASTACATEHICAWPLAVIIEFSVTWRVMLSERDITGMQTSLQDSHTVYKHFYCLDASAGNTPGNACPHVVYVGTSAVTVTADDSDFDLLIAD